jgi:hypothetical protein
MANGVISKSLLWLGEKLLSAVPAIAKLKKEDRDCVAKYCKKIAKCLDICYAELNKGRVPRGRCIEMKGYLDDMEGVIKKVVPPSDVDELKGVLKVAYLVEHLNEEIKNASSREDPFAEVDIAAGKFRSVSARLSATR